VKALSFVTTTRRTIIVTAVCIIAVHFLNIRTTYGQTNQQDTTILMKAFREITRQEQIVYVDTVDMKGYVPDDLKRAIKKGKITDERKTKPPNSLKLTKTEQNYLLERLGQQTVWADNLFTDGRCLNSDSMWIYLREENTKKIAAINKAVMVKDTLALKKAQSKYSYVFTFTKPVYIRDNTVCLISFAALCGQDCGQSEISFYKKINDEWVKWILVSSADF
jgi:hypothetical protein